MLEERHRKIPDGVVMGRRAFLSMKRRAYEIVGVRITGNELHIDDGSILSSESLFEFVIGKSCVTGNYLSLHKLFFKILGVEGYKALILNARFPNYVRYGKYRIYVGDSEHKFFRIASGRSENGYLYCGEIDLDPIEMSDLSKKMLSSLSWKNDGIMKPISKMAEDCLRNTSLVSISMDRIPPEIHEHALNTFRGGVMIAHMLGTGHNVSSYDFNMAYLTPMRELLAPNFPYMKWVFGKTIPENAFYGYARVRVSCEIPLVATRLGLPEMEERLFMPVGEFNSWLTLSEIRLVQKYGKLLKIEEGCWGVPTSLHIYPFRKTVTLLLESLENIGSDNKLRSAIKNMCSILWGKFISPSSVLFNPIYATEITARNRVRLAEAIVETDRKDIIALTIDGIESHRALPSLESNIGKDLGMVKKKEYKSMISGTDQYRENGEEHPWTFEKNGVRIISREVGPSTIARLGAPIEELGTVAGSLLIPYASAKRSSPDRLSYASLRHQHYLKPPTIDDCAWLLLHRNSEIYIDNKMEISWNT